MSYGRNRQNRLSGPQSCPFFGVQTAARLPPHPDAPRPLVLWDETETESEAPIISYGPFFAAHEAVRYSPPGAPATDRTRPNPTECVRRVRIPHRGPSRGRNHPPGGRNRRKRPKCLNLTHISVLQPPLGYPPIPMPLGRWSRGTKRKRNRRPRS